MKDPKLKNIYNIGRYKNFVQVFGENKWRWILPFFGDEIDIKNGFKCKKNV